jgi:hypothetical protein
MIQTVNWKYYKVAQGGPAPFFFARIDEDEEIAEVRELNEAEWERHDVWFGEIHFNGRGAPCSEAEALAVVPA